MNRINTAWLLVASLTRFAASFLQNFFALPFGAVAFFLVLWTCPAHCTHARVVAGTSSMAWTTAWLGASRLSLHERCWHLPASGVRRPAGLVYAQSARAGLIFSGKNGNKRPEMSIVDVTPTCTHTHVSQTCLAVSHQHCNPWRGGLKGNMPIPASCHCFLTTVQGSGCSPFFF